MRSISVNSSGYNSSYDITEQVIALLKEAEVPDGLYGLFAHGSTIGITVMRYEPGAVEDLLRALNKVAPDDVTYMHGLTTKDPNGFSHIRSSLLGTSLLVPWIDGALGMSVKHRIVLFDFDLVPAERVVYLDTRER